MSFLLLEGSAGKLLLEDGVSRFLLETFVPPPTPGLGSALTVGSVNKKYVVYFGLKSIDGTKLSAVPKGTFIATTATASETQGSVQQTLHGFDIVQEFNFPVYATFPHALYGNQTDIRYDAKYDLSNPSTDLKTYVCDAKNFMTAITDNAFFSADWTTIFGAVTSGSPVNVYVGYPGSPSASPVASSTYTWNPATGTVTFSTAQASNAIVSIDGVPQAMSPELMLTHLFVDYAQWSPSAMSLQTSNCLLPTYVGGSGETVWQIAKDIVAMTAPRFVAWQIRIDEYGQINFYETKTAVQPSETIIDERDLFSIQYTLTSDQLSNVITAEAVSNTNQPLKSIAYSPQSVIDNGQRAAFDVPTNLLLCTRGMPSATAISVLNTFTAGQLDLLDRVTLSLECNVLPNFNRQVGDKVTILERSLGISGPYIISGIQDEISLGIATQSIRFTRANIFANMSMGLPSGVTNATAQTIQLNTQSIGGRTNIMNNVTINNQVAILNGATNKDSYGAAVIPVVSPTRTWTFSVTLDPTQAYDTALFHYLYAESPNTLSLSPMAIRMSGFGDGTIIPAATVGAGSTTIVTHTTGTALGGSESAYFYNNMIVASNSIVTPSGANTISATITNNAAAQLYLGTNTTYGITYGSAFTGSYAWLPNLKYNYFYLCLLAVSAQGALHFLRIPFIVSL
jgi:hypothetical protein